MYKNWGNENKEKFLVLMKFLSKKIFKLKILTWIMY